MMHEFVARFWRKGLGMREVHGNGRGEYPPVLVTADSKGLTDLVSVTADGKGLRAALFPSLRRAVVDSKGLTSAESAFWL